MFKRIHQRRLKAAMRDSRFLRYELYITMFSAALGLLLHSPAPIGTSHRRDPSTVAAHVATLGQWPLYFEENRGQGPREAAFFARGDGFVASFTAHEVLIAPDVPAQVPASAYSRCRNLRCIETGEGLVAVPASREVTPHPSPKPLRIGWKGMRRFQHVQGGQTSAARVNYFTGSDPASWQRNVPLYESVLYPEVARGIDLVFYGRQRELEFDLIVRAGADPSSFTMTLDSADHVELTPQGELRITTSGDTMVWRRPYIYQETATAGGDIRQRVQIAGNYRLDGGNRLQFEIGDYDRSRTLIIDPILQYSSYIGGNSADVLSGIGLDAQRNIYVAGTTASANYPTASAFSATKRGGRDMVISKLDPTGTRLIYSTFLGGDGDDTALQMAVGADGSVTVVGSTNSMNFPVATAAQSSSGGASDAVVARLNPAGSALTFSTYLGGAGAETALAVSVDSAGAAYVSGFTDSTNYPTLNAFRASNAGGTDAFVAKYSATGTRVFSTYLGGSATDTGLGIAVDSSGGIAVAGGTNSINFPVASAFQTALGGGQCSDAGVLFACGDAFVTRLSAAGSSLVSSSYFGGNGDDWANSLAMDSSGAIYLTGYTGSGNFPTRTPLQAASGGLSDAFVAKFTPAANALVFSTYLGGTVDDNGTAIAVDSANTVYVSGYTESNNFPLVNSLQGRSGAEAFVSRFNPSGTGMSFSTFLGGSDSELALALAVDNNGNAYVAGWTNSDDFPMRTPLQSQPGGGICGTAPLQYICEDGFIARITHQPGLFTNGTVNGASFAPAAPIAPGSIASAFGADLAGGSFFASNLPLPTSLGGLSLTMNNIAAPLFFVGSSQVNLQVPWELAGQNSATILASIGGVAVSQTTVPLAPNRPGLFSTNAQGTGQGAILIANTADLVAPVGAIPGRTSRPAARGETITIFATGLGPVSNRPATGAPGPSAPPFALTTTTPLVSIGGQSATVSFSGLAPGFVGLYQVNASVPLNSPLGGAVPVVLTIGGVASNTVTIAVQ